MLSAVNDLPDPDSPTMPTVSPAPTEKLSPRTIGTGPSAPSTAAVRSVTCSGAWSVCRSVPRAALTG